MISQPEHIFNTQTFGINCGFCWLICIFFRAGRDSLVYLLVNVSQKMIVASGIFLMALVSYRRIHFVCVNAEVSARRL